MSWDQVLFLYIPQKHKDTWLVEVADASKNNGANVQQWQSTYNDCQKYNLKTENIPVVTTVTTTAPTTTATMTVQTKTITIVTTSLATPTELKPLNIPGDVNNDGAFTISDIVLLQKWIVAVPNVKLDNWQTADLNADNRLNVFDVCLMKRLYLKS